MIRSRKAILVISAMLSTFAGHPALGAAEPIKSSSDIVCGPRCVQFLMRFFRPDSSWELLDIVAKVQPEFEKGSSLAELESYLNANGLHTLAIEPGPTTAIRWPSPVLVHLKVEDKALGHYVVLLPDSDAATATVWTGLTGNVRMPTWELAGQFGGGALLISPSPINKEAIAFPSTRDASLRRIGWLAILIATPIPLLTWRSAFPAFRHKVVAGPDRSGDEEATP